MCLDPEALQPVYYKPANAQAGPDSEVLEVDVQEFPVLLAVLKIAMVLIMVGGGVAVLRELIPMACGRKAASRETPEAGKEA